MKSMGICLGASTIKIAILEQNELGSNIIKTNVLAHHCNPKDAFNSILNSIDINSFDYGILTGRKFKDKINHPSITETEAIEYGLEYVYSSDKKYYYKAVVSLGAENFIAYILDNNGTVNSIKTGNKCASGTGEFFLQQIRRMDVDISEAVNLACESDIYKVSGRCSVFCKSDCTHALNKGIPVGRVSAGLCSMIAEKVVDLFGMLESSPVLAIGGVTKNHAVMQFLKKRVPLLSIPEYADTFEAVGAAYFALKNQSQLSFKSKNIFLVNNSSFDSHPPISKGESLVSFKKESCASAQNNDICIVGLDVGSTTTKAVLMRLSDNAILASIYLRTNGNPVRAARECYSAILNQMNVSFSVVGIGTTGSGRQIAALHAQTPAVINEIIAHAAAAAFYDPEVDTIFEIGGQDAKYTYLVNGVPADYAMNEACSAGTGSFLEEAAKESLNIDFRDIASIALIGMNPPNFNDQCAAFISSDIKTATNECINQEDIIAGLVYSICLNYVNRVKGQRTMGKKIFMQGGVCYNRAVPLAMANLISKEIIVPPDPGLMGALGVALETKKLIENGTIKKNSYCLETLSSRDINYGKSFICNDTKNICDRKCEINILILDEKKYPFGGACNKYYNLISNVNHDQNKYNWVQTRNDLHFNKFTAPNPPNASISIGIPRSFLTNMLLPLYSHFFTSLGCKVILSNNVDQEGIKFKRTAYCYPGEIAHGTYYNLLLQKPDYIFLPRVTELFVDNSQSRKPEHQCTCLLLQSEAYYLKSAFKDIPGKPATLSPLIDFSRGYETQTDEFVKVGLLLGKTSAESKAAYLSAVEHFKKFRNTLKNKGLEILGQLKQDSSQRAIVLFGRPYNAFAYEANLNIPAKFASKGIHIIPWDFIPFDDESLSMDMCWAIGQNLMKAASFAAKNSQMYGVYISNFSCGPDSFLITYFRDIMGSKPSLTLELDSHSADAGVNTRIEAFLDIIKRHSGKIQDNVKSNFTPAKITFEKNKIFFSGSEGTKSSLTDNNVHVLFPSMGKLSSDILASVFSGCGIRASAIPVYDMEVLKKGRSVASCKECLPLLLTTGGLLEYIHARRRPDEKIVYFMPTTPGNCRFTQYHVFQERLINKEHLENVALLSLTNENGYSGLSTKCMLNTLKGLIIADVMDDIKNSLLVLSIDKSQAIETFSQQWEVINNLFRMQRDSDLYSTLEKVSKSLASIPLKYPISQAKKIDLLGEIFVRRDDFSCRDVIDRLAKRDIIVRRAHTLEWLNYCDWNVKHGIYHPEFSLTDWIKFKSKGILGKRYEYKIKSILSKSALYEFELVDIDTLINYGKQFFDVHLTGEAILVVGSFFRNIIHNSHGVISIGPFACMPTRIIDSVLSAEASMKTKISLDNALGSKFHYNLNIESLPFLSIETDGNPFPQIIEARLEAFCLQVERLYKKICKQPEADFKLLTKNTFGV